MCQLRFFLSGRILRRIPIIKQDEERTKQLENILDKLYENWRDVRRETITELGEAESLKIIDFHANNWIDITRWISSKYERHEQMNIVSFQFSRCFKEIYWCNGHILTISFLVHYLQQLPFLPCLDLHFKERTCLICHATALGRRFNPSRCHFFIAPLIKISFGTS